MKKTAVFGLILLFTTSVLVFSEKTSLERLWRYPVGDDDYYFRPIVSLLAAGKTIYAVDNLDHKLLAFEFEPDKGIRFLRVVGRRGQGPGELQYPLSLSRMGNVIALKSTGDFSFFDMDGKYLDRFIVPPSDGGIAGDEKYLYWIHPGLDMDHLVEVRDRRGNRVSTFGTRFFKEKIPDEAREAGHFFSSLYEGALFIHAGDIVYLNAPFGRYFRFTREGTVSASGSLSLVEEGEEKIVAHNRTVLVGRKGVAFGPLFDDAFLYKNMIYLVKAEFVRQNEKDQRTRLTIKSFEPTSMTPVGEFEIVKEGPCRINSAIAAGSGGVDFFLFSVTMFEEGEFLEVYPMTGKAAQKG